MYKPKGEVIAQVKNPASAKRKPIKAAVFSASERPLEGRFSMTEGDKAAAGIGGGEAAAGAGAGN